MVEVKTCLDKTALLKLNRFHLFRKNFLMFPIFIVVFLALGVLMYLFPDAEGEEYLGIVFALLGGIGLPLFIYATMRFMVWLQTRSSKFISNETQLDYKFDENVIYNRMQKPGMISTSEWEWSMCYRAYETKDYFFIYINNMSAHVIPKKDIILGGADEFSNLLQGSIKKFKKY